VWNHDWPDHLTHGALKQSRSGFTLIELMVVILIVGILAAVAIPKFGNTRQKAVVASMKSDLHNLVTAEEAYWVENRTYYGGIIPGAGLYYEPSQGVAVTIAAAGDSGWSATAAAPGLTAITCAIFFGSTAPLAPATADGAPACN
jgi:type IV pilus assembly protein PilA